MLRARPWRAELDCTTPREAFFLLGCNSGLERMSSSAHVLYLPEGTRYPRKDGCRRFEDFSQTNRPAQPVPTIQRTWHQYMLWNMLPTRTPLIRMEQKRGRYGINIGTGPTSSVYRDVPLRLSGTGNVRQSRPPRANI